VFIIGCEEGVFPHSRALDEGSLEEERRLCYVGITRAMRELTFTYARRRALFGAESYGLRSRFLDEIPAELTDRSDDFLGSGLGARAGADDGGASGIWAAAAAGESGGAPAPQFRMGEDVAHAAFGEGVVTGLEPGGIVVVRFARDGSERKLLAGIAPVTRR
jgi:DNA helicase II / ATP-dependent DNA helicase PcrA